MSKTADDAPVTALLSEGRWLRGLALCLAHDRADADDLMQDTWMAAIRSPPEARGSMRPWLAQVVRNLRRRGLRDGFRRQRREDSLSRLREDAVGSTEEMLAQLELQRLVSELVRELEEPYRSTLLLRFFEGRSSADVARALSIPPGTVRWRLNEALQRLRVRLDEAHGGNRATWKAALAVPLAAPPGANAGAAAAGRTIRSGTSTITWATGGLLLPALVGGLLIGFRPRHPGTTTSPDRPVAQTRPRRVETNEISNHEQAMNKLLGVVVPALVASAEETARTERPPATRPAPSALCVPGDNPVGCIPRISREDLPAAVEAALARATSGRDLDELEIELRPGQARVTYDVRFEVTEDLDEKLTFAEDGTFVESQIDVAPDDLPALAKRVVSDAFPAALVTRAELHNEAAGTYRKRYRSASVFYQIDVRAADGTHRLYVTEDGKVLKSYKVQ